MGVMLNGVYHRSRPRFIVGHWRRRVGVVEERVMDHLGSLIVSQVVLSLVQHVKKVAS